MKNILKAVIVIAMTVTVAVTAYAEPAGALSGAGINAKQAKAIALNDAKTKASKIRNYRIKGDKEDRSYEIRFVVKKNCRVYSYEIDRSTGIIMERDIDYKYKKTCSRKKIGKEAAIKKVIKRSKFDASIVRSGTCTYRYKHHEGTYQVKFRAGDRIYEYELLAPNGRIKEIEYKYAGEM